MKKLLLTLFAVAFITSAVAQDARPQRGGDQPQINREEVTKARELLTTDEELKKIVEKYQAALTKRLKALGISEETAKSIAQPRGRGPGSWGNRQGGPRDRRGNENSGQRPPRQRPQN